MIILKGRALKATAVSHLDQKADAAYKRTAAMQMFLFHCQGQYAMHVSVAEKPRHIAVFYYASRVERKA